MGLWNAPEVCKGRRFPFLWCLEGGFSHLSVQMCPAALCPCCHRALAPCPCPPSPCHQQRLHQPLQSPSKHPQNAGRILFSQPVAGRAGQAAFSLMRNWNLKVRPNFYWIQGKLWWPGGTALELLVANLSVPSIPCAQFLCFPLDWILLCCTWERSPPSMKCFLELYSKCEK